MNPFETISLSLSSIFRNRLRSFLTILGIVIGVFSVILLIALVSGLQTFITKQISGLGSNVMFVLPGKIGGTTGPGEAINRLTTQHVTSLSNDLKGEAEISAAVTRVTTVQNGNKSVKNSSVVGTLANMPNVLEYYQVEKGRFFNEPEENSGKRVVVIGSSVKNELFADKDPLGETIEISNLKYKVVGVLGKKGAVFGQDQDNTAIIPLITAQKQFGFENVNAIYISTKKSEDVKPVQEKVKKVLAKRLSEDDFTVQTSEQTLATISQITGVLTIALGGIAAISLLVGGIGVMNIMLVSVTERTREIGLRKALGAKGKDIRNQFLIEALTLSGLGGIIGILLGVGAAHLVNIFFTTTVTWWSILLSFGFSMLVGIIFGVAPAIRAARLDPIQALRYE
jgi:ABC-type antimicrobial peptide transport system permease subunit